MQIRNQLNIDWGPPKHPDCSGIAPELLKNVDWHRIDLGEWLALLDQQNRLPTINDDVLKNLNLEYLTGQGSRLATNQTREGSINRLKSRYQGIAAEHLNRFHQEKTHQLRNK